MEQRGETPAVGLAPVLPDDLRLGEDGRPFVRTQNSQPQGCWDLGVGNERLVRGKRWCKVICLWPFNAPALRKGERSTGRGTGLRKVGAGCRVWVPDGGRGYADEGRARTAAPAGAGETRGISPTRGRESRFLV